MPPQQCVTFRAVSQGKKPSPMSLPKVSKHVVKLLAPTPRSDAMATTAARARFVPALVDCSRWFLWFLWFLCIPGASIRTVFGARQTRGRTGAELPRYAASTAAALLRRL